MQSNEGVYYERLDHVRALAAFMVFCWHFIHLRRPDSVPFEAVPWFPPLSLLEEGHVGVSLFMVLSGYLFSKLTIGKAVQYRSFLVSRAIRLGPLLIITTLLWILVGYATGDTVSLRRLAQFLYTRSLPGFWSLTIELHFYLIFPLLLWAVHRWSLRVLSVALALSLIIRAVAWAAEGSVQDLAYWTIVGRLDQFVAGMILARVTLQRPALWAAVAGVSLILVAHGVNMAGGFYGLGEYPSRSPLWIVLPTVEAVTFAIIVAWYDRSGIVLPKPIGKFLAKVGVWSYAIYLLHFFLRVAIMKFWPWVPASIGGGVLFAALWFIAFLPVAAAAHILIERPFFRFRLKYLTPASGSAEAAARH